MDDSELINKQVMVVVENQMKNNDPPETLETFNRLVESGFSAEDAKHLIGRCVAVEIFLVLRDQKPFDRNRFIRNLEQLPSVPED